MNVDGIFLVVLLIVTGLVVILDCVNAVVGVAFLVLIVVLVASP